MAAKRKPKVTDRRSATNGKKPPRPVNPADPGEKTFVQETYQQTVGLLPRVADPTQRKGYETRLKAIRAKFAALPKGKVTKDRVERYVGEITKIGREIVAGV